MSIRPLYDKFGVDGFYQRFSKEYFNPHQIFIEELIKNSIEQHDLDYSTVLDLCCGHGEATNAILKCLPNIEIEGLDKFMASEYQKKTNKYCHLLSFRDILQDDSLLKNQYSTIICSFGLHLCPKDQLFSLITLLFEHTQTIIIITPHKRPRLEDLNNICSLDFVIDTKTDRGKKVFLKCYRKN